MVCSQLATKRSSVPPSTSRTPGMAGPPVGSVPSVATAKIRKPCRLPARLASSDGTARPVTSTTDPAPRTPMALDSVPRSEPALVSLAMARYSSTWAALSPGRTSMAVPSVAASTTSWPALRPARTTLAATDTARSSDSPA